MPNMIIAFRRPTTLRAVLATSIFLLSTEIAAAQEDTSADQVRQYIVHRAGGLNKLTVPSSDAAIPVPPPRAGNTAYRYRTTEAKRYLGKLLFHDPVRTARIDPAYGAVPATAQTGSCGSCHFGQVSAKAGQQFNFNLGGEGQGYTDASGNFFARRRPRTDLLVQQRNTQLFPGDALVDILPTLTDVDLLPPCPPGTLYETIPARAHKMPPVCEVFATGRLDPLDSVGRQSPSLIGSAFNNRLLLGGFAGESTYARQGFNPNNDPAQENLTLLLMDAHRILTDVPLLPGELHSLHGEVPELLKIPAFVRLFRDAFPEEAAKAAAANDIRLLVSDDTAFRATATFLRTAVTRNTPYDRFLAGDNNALTAGQLRGALLFFKPAAGGAGGAGCAACHSGPVLNKQQNDPDVAGVGQFVEENFVNVGIGDHPLQALNRQPQFGDTANHRDTGRQEISMKVDDAFKFRVPTMRQLKEAVTFFHDGSPRFQTVRDVVAYFNAGVPEDPIYAGAAPTLDPRFTHPRGPGFAGGLGLSEAQIDDIADFLENGLYDPAFSHYDPNSPTRLFELDPKELAYSKYHPELAALGAKDGFVLSGLAMNSNDPLTRRDEGLEFLDVTNRLRVDEVGFEHDRLLDKLAISLTNVSKPQVTLPGVVDSASVIDTNLLIVVKGLDPAVTLANASGTTAGGDPYLRVFLPNGILAASQSITRTLVFEGASGTAPPSYQLAFLSGQGTP